MKRGFKLSASVATLTLCIGSVATLPVSAADRSDRLSNPVPAHISELKLDKPQTAQGIVRDLGRPTGPQQVIVRLRDVSVARHPARTPAGRIAHKEKLKNDQAKFISRVTKANKGTKVLATSQMVLNAVFLEVDADAIDELAQDKDVFSIHRVRDYEMDLSETVPYIGASAVQVAGFDGAGVRVAVLDSGIDYYHAAFGGSGNPADYAADDPNIIEPGTFPTAKVVDGFDFVGSVWPFGPLLPDPDPLDDGSQAGHGSHVGHIIGGIGGVAPGADLYAVKVCSSVSSSCSGIALINGMNFAVDPDGDGDPSDAVDVINMSLGSLYGQAFDDDLALAVDNATALGVLSVISAGNSSDKPYANGTPSSAATALSVAQTNVPSAVLPLMEVTAPGSIAGFYQAVFQPWSVPLASVIEEPVVYGNGSGGNLNGCAPFAPGTFAGEIVLVDRGACRFDAKIKNIGDGGGLIGIIGLVAPGDPFGGGGDPITTIPGFMISQADSNTLKSGLPATVVRFDPDVGIPLVMAMVGSSSRGPQHESTTLIKPDIGAPGASVSAIAGTGIAEGPFGGTSGAAPMVSGSAALLMQAYPDLTPLEVKARLMNNGETDILNDAVTGELAPITRIGGGEVRVDSAHDAPAAAWDDAGFSGSLSFGFVDASKDVQILHKTVRVRNYSDHAIKYNIEPTFRFADDAASGAVSIDVSPNPLNVPAGQDRTVNVKMTINGALLPGNFMNSGSQGANGSALTANEFDGYLNFDDGEQPIHMAWHVLPRRSADVSGARPVLTFLGGVDNVSLTNVGVGTAQNDAYSLLAVSPNQPEGGLGQQSPMPDIRAVGINTIPVPAGFCSGSGQSSFLWLFAINTWERQEHLVPVIHNVILDTDQDGTDDFIVFNLDLNLGAISDGRQVTWVQNLATNGLSAFFFAEHSTNTGNTVLIICGEQIGLTGTDLLSTNVDMDVFTQDFYFGGPGDFVGGLTVTPLGEQYFGIPSDIAGKSHGTMTVVDFGPFPGNSQELGVMLITNGDRGTGARGGATQGTEALLFEAK